MKLYELTKRKQLTLYYKNIEDTVNKLTGLAFYYNMCSNATRTVIFSYHGYEVDKKTIVELRKFFYDNFPYILKVDTSEESFISITFQEISSLYAVFSDSYRR